MKKFEFQIDFEFFGKRIKTTVKGNTPDDALDELFAAIRKQTKIHAIDKPMSEHNKRAAQSPTDDREEFDTPFGKMKVKKDGSGKSIIDDLLNQMKNGMQ